MREHHRIASGSFRVFFILHLLGTWLGMFATNSVAQNFVDTGIPFVGLTEASAAWGDYDNDGDLDFVQTGSLGPGGQRQITWIYRNDGGGRFSLVVTNLPGLAYGSVAWGDYDGDGDLDLLIAGLNGTNTLAAIFRNDGNDTFTDIHVALPGLHLGVAVWADYDNDGDLDVLLSGSPSVTRPVPGTQLFRNDGGNTFTPVQSALPNLWDSSAAWGDIDNDGDLDLFLGGIDASGRYGLRIFGNLGDGIFTNDLPPLEVRDVSSSVEFADFDNDGDLDALVAGRTIVYRNDGTNVFTSLSLGLPQTSGGRAAWGDYDNDGRPDILLVGAGIARVYRNNPNGTVVDIGAALPGIQQGDAAWGDFDGDGKLDCLLTGVGSRGGFTKLYRNQTLQTHSPPPAPVNLTAMISGRRALFSWSPGSDGTPTTGLTYNMRVGTSPGSEDVLPAMADFLSGFRRIPKPGNTSLGTHWFLDGLPVGIYYWSVQAIDHSFAGSAFSAEQSFVVPPAANEQPLLRLKRQLPTGEFALTLIGNPGTDYSIDISTNLTLWTQWRVMQSSNAVITLSDSDILPKGNRFYRARQWP